MTGRDGDAASPFSAVRDVVAGGGDLDLADVAARAGLPLEVLREVFATVEWADRPSYDERDVDYAEAVGRMLDHYPLEAVVRSLRTRYRAMASIVVSDLGTVRDRVVAPAFDRGADVEEVAELLGRTAEEILPLVTTQLAEDYRHVLVRLIDSEAVARGVDTGGGRELELAVGFVDVVGFTALSGRIDPTGLDEVLAGFEDLVADVVGGTEAVLLAKYIGDAAMIVGSDVVTVADVLLTLVEDRSRLADVPRRAGLAAGGVLVREGDYYGPVTNLAARLTDHARPWSLLAAEDTQQALEDGFALSRLPRTPIHGFGERRPLRVRRRDGG